MKRESMMQRMRISFGFTSSSSTTTYTRLCKKNIVMTYWAGIDTG
jgi:hypothetical protein